MVQIGLQQIAQSIIIDICGQAYGTAVSSCHALHWFLFTMLPVTFCTSCICMQHSSCSPPQPKCQCSPVEVKTAITDCSSSRSQASRDPQQASAEAASRAAEGLALQGAGGQEAAARPDQGADTGAGLSATVSTLHHFITGKSLSFMHCTALARPAAWIQLVTSYEKCSAFCHMPMLALRDLPYCYSITCLHCFDNCLYLV